MKQKKKCQLHKENILKIMQSVKKLRINNPNLHQKEKHMHGLEKNVQLKYVLIVERKVPILQ